MSSKECLERLLKIAYVEPGPTKEKFITYARETEHNKKCSDLYNIISQDLDRLEKLEKENQELKEKVKMLKELNDINKKFADLATKAIQENNKLKKVIEILENKFELFIFESDNIYYVGNEYAVGKLIQEEYELLKEVLENVG